MLQNLRLENERLRAVAEAVPMLELEILREADRADALEQQNAALVARADALAPLAHLRMRARQQVQGAVGIRCLSACCTELLVQRAFVWWRTLCVGGLELPAVPGTEAGLLSRELQQADARIADLGIQMARLEYDNLLHARTARAASVQARRAAAACTIRAMLRGQHSWLLARAWLTWSHVHVDLRHLPEDERLERLLGGPAHRRIQQAVRGRLL